MKRRGWLPVLFLFLLLSLAGCTAQPSASFQDRGVEAVPVARPEASEPEASEEAQSRARHSQTLDAPADDVIEIKERLFVAQTNDVYYNSEDYLGKTFKYEGIFQAYENPNMEERFYAVIRYGPGCCGIDMNCGFEVKWDGKYPKANDWVEAVGVLEKYELDGSEYLRIALTSLNVLPVRGAETVTA